MAGVYLNVLRSEIVHELTPGGRYLSGPQLGKLRRAIMNSVPEEDAWRVVVRPRDKTGVTRVIVAPSEEGDPDDLALRVRTVIEAVLRDL